MAPDLLVAWTRVVGHAGLHARLADPLGFAIRQLQQGHPPPPSARLDTWATQAPPAATPWTVDDVARLNQDYGDVFRLGSGRTMVPTDGPRPPTGNGVRAGPWTTAEVARLNQAYGDLFRLGSACPGPQAPDTMTTADGSRGKPRASAGTPRAGVPVTPAAQQPHAAGADPALAARLVAELRLRAGRGLLRTLLDQVTLRVQDGTVQIGCQKGAQVASVYAHLVPLLPTVLAELGVRARVVVGVQMRDGP